MVTNTKASKIHPLTAAAAIALIFVCLTGIAAMLGVLPNFSKSTPPVAASEPVAITAQAPAPVVVPSVAPSTALAKVEQPAPPPKVVHKKTVKRAANTTPPNQYDRYDQTSPSHCPNCGVVESVRAIEQEAPTSGVGAGIGAVVGGLLGNQVGSGNGRTLATIAGAVGGGYAGNVIEKKRQTSTAYEVIVRMNDGGRQRFMMNEQRWRSGDPVRVDGNNLIAQ